MVRRKRGGVVRLNDGDRQALGWTLPPPSSAAPGTFTVGQQEAQTSRDDTHSAGIGTNSQANRQIMCGITFIAPYRGRWDSKDTLFDYRKTLEAANSNTRNSLKVFLRDQRTKHPTKSIGILNSFLGRINDKSFPTVDLNGLFQLKIRQIKLMFSYEEDLSEDWALLIKLHGDCTEALVKIAPESCGGKFSVPQDDILRRLRTQQFTVDVSVEDAITTVLRFDVHLNEAALTDNPLSDLPMWSTADARRHVFAWQLGLPTLCDDADMAPPQTGSMKDDVSAFYHNLTARRHRVETAAPISSLDPQHPSLVPLLRPYQREAVLWMLSRELNEGNSAADSDRWKDLFTEIQLGGGEAVYYESGTTVLTRKPDVVGRRLRGGILAEEMGLGKTVETLALTLLHRRDSTSSASCGMNAQRGFDVTTSADGEVAQILDELVSSVVASSCREEAVETSPRRTRKRKTVEHKNGTGKKRRRMEDQIGFLKCPCMVPENTMDNWERIHCQHCGKWQHKKCMNWAWPDEHGYCCAYCAVTQPAVAIGATLIVSPEAICFQWYEEIQKHIRQYGLKVLIYHGVRVHSFLTARSLAEYDIVICTYETFRSEINFVDLPSKIRGSLRHQKKYLPSPSPLTAVEWWRLCLDEAQMVENVSTAAAEVCLRLSAVNRWCITGTPIQRSINDLYGLVAFLGHEPYNIREWWRRLLYEPYQSAPEEDRPHSAIIQTLSNVLWRTEKAQVVDQLGIPSLREEVHWLDFSPVEEHFYRRTMERCGVELRDILARFPPDTLALRLAQLDHETANKLLRPLIELRRACVHPQATRKGRFQEMNTKTLTMEEVLEKMLKETTRECEEQQRAVVLALNGLAGVHWLREEFADAARRYREVLSTEGRVRVDPLPRIHALHNLSALITEQPILPRLPTDAHFDAEVTRLTDEYLAEGSAKVDKCRTDVCKETEARTQVLNELFFQIWRAASYCKKKFENGFAAKFEQTIVDLPLPLSVQASFDCPVLIYHGVRVHSFLTARSLAEYDIVICTYETFRSEINFVDLPSKIRGSLRHQKKYLPSPSPLTAVEWWRLCLDEAQMVENVSTAAAEVCLRLSAVNRWCITGTPIQRSINDLYGLVAFLGHEPYNIREWWRRLLYEPYQSAPEEDRPHSAIIQTLSNVLWRTEKAQVVDQLGIPSLREEVHWLDFSPVEEHFYRRTMERCGVELRDILARFPPDTLALRLAQLDHETANKLLRPLIELRRACVHPQATRKGRFQEMNTKTLTMEEVLEKMLKETTRECEEQQRAVVLALNGLAGVHWLREEFADAARRYREVLSTEGRVRVDPLPRIHALHNLSALITEQPILPRLPTDAHFDAEVTRLTDEYLAEGSAKVDKCRTDVCKETEARTQVLNELFFQIWRAASYCKKKFENGFAAKFEQTIVDLPLPLSVQASFDCPVLKRFDLDVTFRELQSSCGGSVGVCYEIFVGPRFPCGTFDAKFKSAFYIFRSDPCGNFCVSVYASTVF